MQQRGHMSTPIHKLIAFSQPLSEALGGNTSMFLTRQDLRELYVHLGPLVLRQAALTTPAWAHLLSVGVGMANLEAKRLKDNEGTITGILRDYPSIHCTLSMHVTEMESEPKLHLKSITMDLNGND